MVETKMFDDNGMLLQMKLIPTIGLHKNTFSTKKTGDFNRTSKVLILRARRTDPTSKRHFQPCSN